MPFSGIAIYKNRRLAADVNRLLDTHVLAHFPAASALSAPSLRLSIEGKTIKLIGRTFLAPHRGSSPKGRGGYVAVLHESVGISIASDYST